MLNSDMVVYSTYLIVINNTPTGGQVTYRTISACGYTCLIDIVN